MNKIIFGAIFGIIIILLYPTIGETSETVNNEQTIEEIEQNLKTAEEHVSPQLDEVKPLSDMKSEAIQILRNSGEKPRSVAYDLPEINKQIPVDKNQIAQWLEEPTEGQTIRNIKGGIESVGTQIINAWVGLNLLGLKYASPNMSDIEAKTMLNIAGRSLTSIRESQQSLIKLNRVQQESFEFLIAAFITTCVVGLFPIVIIRYLIIMHPVSIKKAYLVAAINSVMFWLIFSGIAIMNGAESRIGIVWILVLYLAMKILSYNKGKNNIDNNVHIK